MKNDNLRYLAASFIAMLLSLTAQAEILGGSCGNNLSWELNTQTYVLSITGSGDMYDYDFLNEENRAPWWSRRSFINTVKLPVGLTSIGNSAFAYCPLLTSVNIPSTVNKINDYAFDQCMSLPSIVIPEGVDSIGEFVFLEDTLLTSVYLPSTLADIGKGVFSGCKNLSSVVSDILNPNEPGENAFYGISPTCTLTIPNGKRMKYMSWPFYSTHVIEGILSNGDFLYNLNPTTHQATLVTVSSNGNYTGETGPCEIPATISYNGEVFDVTAIGERAFYDNKNYSSITLPTSITSIGKSAFYGCSNLTSIHFSMNVVHIGEEAFSGCSSLANVSSDIQEPFAYDYGAFSGIPANCELTVPFGTSAAYNAARWTAFGGGIVETDKAKIDDIYYQLFPSTQRAWVTFAGSTLKDYADEYSGDVVIPSTVSYQGVTYNVTGIGAAFAMCTHVTSVTIPEGVDSIEGAFFGCSNLTSIDLPSSVIYIGGGTFAMSGLTSFTIPEGITAIKAMTFTNTPLTSITIPSSVTVIEEQAFMMSALPSISLPENLESIGEQAFAGCSLLTSVTFPSTLTSIGDKAFLMCSSLNSVVSGISTPFTFGANAFREIADSCVLSVPYGKMLDYKQAGWTEEVFKGGIEDFACIKIGDLYYALDETNRTASVTYKSMTLNSYSGDVTVPASVTYKDVTYDVTAIGTRAFQECTNLTSVTLPESLTSIATSAFYRSSLTSIYIPEGVTSIGTRAFQACSNLTNVYLPSTLTSIGERAFFNCSSLEEVHSGIEVPFAYGDQAFTGISNSCYLYVPNGTTATYNQAGWKTIPDGGDFGSIVEDAIRIDGIYYLLWGENEAFVVRGSCKYSGDIVIPATITTPEGDVYDVTSIEPSAFSDCPGLISVVVPEGISLIGVEVFANCTNLASITLPASVTRYWYDSFKNCMNLTSVTVQNPTPASITSETFPNRANATLYVPYGSKAAYQAASYWNQFNEIVEIISSIDLVDGESYTGYDVEIPVRELTYSRTYKNTSWQPWYVPFDMTLTSELLNRFSFAKYAGTYTEEDGTFYLSIVRLGEGDKLKANTPYFIQAKTANSNNAQVITVENTILYPAESVSFSMNAAEKTVTVTGIYEPKPVTEEDKGWYAYSGGQYSQQNNVNNTPLKPFRFFVTITDREDNVYTVSTPGKVVEILPSLTLADGQTYTNDVAKSVRQLTYSRTYKNTNWQPWYVPFNMELTSETLARFSFAKYAGTYTEEDGTFFLSIVRLGEGDVLKANTPYFVQAKTADSNNAQDITVQSARLYPAESNSFSMSAAEKTVTVTGIYEQKVVTEEDQGWYAYSGGRYSQQTKLGNTLNPYRFFVTIEDRADSPYIVSLNPSEVKIKVLGKDSETGIEMVESENVQASRVQGRDAIYDLQGRRVEKPVKGLYIVNGKKVLFK